MHLASLYNRLNIVQFLMARGADPNVVNSNGETALHLALLRGYIEIAECLMAKKV